MAEQLVEGRRREVDRTFLSDQELMVTTVELMVTMVEWKEQMMLFDLVASD